MSDIGKRNQPLLLNFPVNVLSPPPPTLQVKVESASALTYTNFSPGVLSLSVTSLRTPFSPSTARLCNSSFLDY